MSVISFSEWKPEKKDFMGIGHIFGFVNDDGCPLFSAAFPLTVEKFMWNGVESGAPNVTFVETELITLSTS